MNISTPKEHAQAITKLLTEYLEMTMILPKNCKQDFEEALEPIISRIQEQARGEKNE